MSETDWLFVGFSTSLSLLVFFLVLQARESKLLALDAKWLVSAAFPILIALVAGGYIASFKGFGIELETLLKNPIGELTLKAQDVFRPLPGDEKRSLQYLDNLPPAQRSQIERLSFIAGRIGYYQPFVVERYLDELPAVQFIEVKKSDGTFICLLPASLLQGGEESGGIQIDEFLASLEANQMWERFRDEAIWDGVSAEDSAIEILPKVRASRYKLLPVISTEGFLQGVVTSSLIERKIADDVLAAKKRSRTRQDLGPPPNRPFQPTR